MATVGSGRGCRRVGYAQRSRGTTRSGKLRYRSTLCHRRPHPRRGPTVGTAEQGCGKTIRSKRSHPRTCLGACPAPFRASAWSQTYPASLTPGGDVTGSIVFLGIWRRGPLRGRGARAHRHVLSGNNNSFHNIHFVGGWRCAAHSSGGDGHTDGHSEEDSPRHRKAVQRGACKHT